MIQPRPPRNGTAPKKRHRPVAGPRGVHVLPRMRVRASSPSPRAGILLARPKGAALRDRFCPLWALPVNDSSAAHDQLILLHDHLGLFHRGDVDQLALVGGRALAIGLGLFHRGQNGAGIGNGGI